MDWEKYIIRLYAALLLYRFVRWQDTDGGCYTRYFWRNFSAILSCIGIADNVYLRESVI